MNRRLFTPAALVAATFLFCSIAALDDALAQARPNDPTATGTSRAFNPAISLNSLMLGHFVSGLDEGMHAEEGEEHAHFPEGFSIQEMELQITADIDPYSRADATIAYHDGDFELEELFARTNRLPAGLGLRVGQMYVPFNTENQLHTHQLPFTQRSLILSAISPEGYTDVGGELRYLTPAPWFLELRGGVYDGGSGEGHHEEEPLAKRAEEEHEHGALFAAPEGEDFAYHAGLSSLWELGESTTFALDGGFLVGRNGLSEDNDTLTQVASGAAILRWKPTRRTIYRGFRLVAEYTHVDQESSLIEEPTRWMGGWQTYAQFQFARRWWVSGRYETLDMSGGEDLQWRAGGSLAFVPSEFQAIRLEFAQVSGHDDDYAEIFLQYNVTIGSHPAHRY